MTVSVLLPNRRIIQFQRRNICRVAYICAFFGGWTAIFVNTVVLTADVCQLKKKKRKISVYDRHSICILSHGTCGV